MKYKDIVYMALDELKLHSDDANFTEEHIIFLADKYRAILLKQRYADVKKEIPLANYQSIVLNVTSTSATAEEFNTSSVNYLKSNNRIPSLMTIGNISVTPQDYYQGDIAYISRERMRYVGYNKYLNNIIYSSIDPENFLYLKSNNTNYLNITKVRLTGIFLSSIDALSLKYKENNITNFEILDEDFPFEDALVSTLIDMIVKELTTAEYHPEDDNNDAKDNLSEVNIKK